MPSPHCAVAACLAALTVALCLTATARAQHQSLMDHEPVEHLKAHLPKKGDEKTVKLEAFLQSPRKELKRKTAKMETNLRKVLETRDHVSAFLVKGSAVLARRAAEGFQFNSTLLLPHSLLLPILSTTLPILLEGYKRELLHNSMGAILKAKHREHADVKNYFSLSLHDLATKLPQGGDSVDFYSATLLPELNGRSKAALFYLNTVLESVAEDAWRDALISVAMDHSAFGDNQQMLTHFKDLASYAEAVGSDIINFHEASKSDLHSLSAGHFLYGWWFNCPRGSGSKGSKDVKCLAPFLPSDSMAVFHQAVRLYTVPRLGLHLLVANTDSSPGGNTPRTLADVLERDRAIWNAIYSVVDPETESRGKKEKGEEEVSTEKTEESGPASEEIPPVKPTPEAEGAQSQGEGEAEGSTETPLPTPEQVPSPEPTAAGDTETQQSTRSLDEEHREKVAPTEPPEMAQETEEDRAKEAPTEMAKETGTPAPETAPPAEPTAAPETQTESEHSREKEEASTEPPETAEEAPTEPPEMAEEAPTEPPEMAEENEPPTQEPVPPAQPTAATPAQGDELLEEPTAAASVTQEPVPPAQPTAATPAQEDELLEEPTAAAPVTQDAVVEEPTAMPVKKEQLPTAAHATEDEVVGEAMPKEKPDRSSKADSSSSQQAKTGGKREAEDEVVDEIREKGMRKEKEREKEKAAREGNEEKKEAREGNEEKKETREREKSLLVRAIKTTWPIAVFLFYTILSHVWVYWLLHLLWLACSSVFSGVYLPRPKTAKQD